MSQAENPREKLSCPTTVGGHMPREEHLAGQELTRRPEKLELSEGLQE